MGLSVGLDNCGGDLSYGNPKNGPFFHDGVSGSYSTHTYTFAIEPKFNYIKIDFFAFYGYVGLGITSFENKFTFLPGISDSSFFYGQQGSLVPSNPYDYRATYWSAQVTPIGIEFGQKIAGFFEFGFGYKGLISGGISLKF